MSFFHRAWNCLKYENPEVTGWLKVAAARGAETVNASLFTASAIILIASQIDDDCDGKIDIAGGSLRITSLISAGSVVENVVNAVLTPWWGTIADITPNRKQLMVFAHCFWISQVALGAILLSFKASLTLLWLFFLTIVLTAVFYELALTLIFAYLPEVVDDSEQLTAVTSRQFAIVNSLQLLLALIMTIISSIIADYLKNDLPLTQISHLIVCLVWLYFAVPGIRMLPSRKRSRERKGKVLGITELWGTLKDSVRKYPNTSLYLFSWMFYFAGVQAVVLIQIAYVSGEFGYTASDVTYLGALLLIFAVPGSMLAEYLGKRYNLKWLLTICVSLWTITVIVAPFLLTGEDRDPEDYENVTIDDGLCPDSELITRQPTTSGALFAYLFAALFGLGIGFIYPISTSLYALMIPGGQEGAYFGLKTFGAKVVSWAPPLVFTVINERFDNLQWAFLSMAIWFSVSIPFILMINLTEAQEHIKDTLDKRQRTHGVFVIKQTADVPTAEVTKAEVPVAKIAEDL